MPAVSIMPHSHRFVKALAGALRRRCRIPARARLLVAVSGGADSVALLRGLALLAPRRGWNLDLAVGHVQHHLRADTQAETDAAFVAELARKLDLPYLRTDLDPRKLRRAGNVEAAARQERYHALGEMALTYDATFIVTAHHADDQLETILMRLLRGASVRGLRGIAWTRRMDISSSIPNLGKTRRSSCLAARNWAPRTPNSVQLIRPMLAVDRQTAREFLKQLGQPWREDHTNVDPTRLRARLRQRVLPELRAIRSDAAAKTVALAEQMRELHRLLDVAISAAADHVTIVGTTAVLDRVAARQLSGLVLFGLLRRYLIRAGLGRDRLGNRCLAPIVRAIRDTTGGQRVFSLGRGVKIMVTRQVVEIRALHV